MIDQHPEVCVASVYNTHEKWGSITASGIRLRNDVPTVAHRTYALGGYLKVTNLRNGHVMVLRVIDRGPYRRGRCVDLTPAADRALGLGGLGRVKVEPWSK